MLGAFLVLVVFTAANMAGTALLRARGFGLISFARAARASPGRAFAARLAGPLAVYLVMVPMFAASLRLSEQATSRIQVVPGFPAEAAGVQDGDQVVEAGGRPISRFNQLQEGVAATGPGKPLELVVLRGGQRLPLRVTTDAGGRIGVHPSGEAVSPAWGEAFLTAMGEPFRTVGVSASTVLRILRGERSEVLGGPIGLARAAGDATPARTFLYALAVNCAFFWPLMVLFALATQVVALARGELGAPAAGRG